MGYLFQTLRGNEPVTNPKWPWRRAYDGRLLYRDGFELTGLHHNVAESLVEEHGLTAWTHQGFLELPHVMAVHKWSSLLPNSSSFIAEESGGAAESGEASASVAALQLVSQLALVSL
jgi:hypothetical protein